jgi:hypothetical protein
MSEARTAYSTKVSFSRDLQKRAEERGRGRERARASEARVQVMGAIETCEETRRKKSSTLRFDDLQKNAASALKTQKEKREISGRRQETKTKEKGQIAKDQNKAPKRKQKQKPNISQQNDCSIIRGKHSSYAHVENVKTLSKARAVLRMNGMVVKKCGRPAGGPPAAPAVARGGDGGQSI